MNFFDHYVLPWNSSHFLVTSSRTGPFWWDSKMVQSQSISLVFCVGVGGNWVMGKPIGRVFFFLREIFGEWWRSRSKGLWPLVSYVHFVQLGFKLGAYRIHFYWTFFFGERTVNSWDPVEFWFNQRKNLVGILNIILFIKIFRYLKWRYSPV